MTRMRLAVGVCVATLMLSAPALAQGPHSDTTKAFNGTSLAGWHPRGAAQWRVANGEIVGFGGERSRTARPRQELSGLHPQVRLPVPGLRCRRRAAQVRFDVEARHAAHSTPASPARTRSRSTASPLDAQGKEIERTQLFKWTARQNPPGHADGASRRARRMEAASASRCAAT